MSSIIKKPLSSFLVKERWKLKDDYATERAAKAALIKLAKKFNVAKEEFAIADQTTFYRDIEKKVERINMMTQKKFLIGINAPPCIDPSTEYYWSM